MRLRRPSLAPGAVDGCLDLAARLVDGIACQRERIGQAVDFAVGEALGDVGADELDDAVVPLLAAQGLDAGAFAVKRRGGVYLECLAGSWRCCGLACAEHAGHLVERHGRPLVRVFGTERRQLLDIAALPLVRRGVCDSSGDAHDARGIDDGLVRAEVGGDGALHLAPCRQVEAWLLEAPVDVDAGRRNRAGAHGGGAARAVEALHVVGGGRIVAIGPQVEGGHDVGVAGAAGDAGADRIADGVDVEAEAVHAFAPLDGFIHPVWREAGGLRLRALLERADLEHDRLWELIPPCRHEQQVAPDFGWVGQCDDFVQRHIPASPFFLRICPPRKGRAGGSKFCQLCCDQGAGYCHADGLFCVQQN